MRILEHSRSTLKFASAERCFPIGLVSAIIPSFVLIRNLRHRLTTCFHLTMWTSIIPQLQRPGFLNPPDENMTT